MSGFFENLAARARGEAPGVRPRLPGLFEAAPAEGFEQTEVFVETAGPEEAAVPVATAPAAADAGGRGAVSERVVAAPMAVPAAPAEPARTDARAVAASRPAAEAAPRREQTAAVPAPDLAHRDRAAFPAMPLMQPPAHRRREDDPAAVVPRPATAARPADDLAVRAVAAPAPLVPAPGVVASVRSSAREIVPQVTRARPPQVQPAPVRHEETTVHVSIGRIEVRAVQPPAEARPRERAKSAVMSLDEYLRSRRERR